MKTNKHGWDEGAFVCFSAFCFLGWFKTRKFTCLFCFGTAWIHVSDSDPRFSIPWTERIHLGPKFSDGLKARKVVELS